MTIADAKTKTRARTARRSPAVLRLIGAAMAGLLGVAAAHADNTNWLTPFSDAPAGQAPAPWRFSSLPNKTPTRFEVVQQGNQRVLKVEAEQSYGNLVHRVQLPLTSATTLSWRWRVDRLVEEADLRTRAGDDGAAKLCVFFDFPVDRLPLMERARLAMARSAIGEDVPSAALCYVWDNKQARGNTMVNAFTRRMRMMVLESGPSATPGAWLTERRNVLADYRRAFADEAGVPVPDVVAVAISADADNTQGHGLAYFSDLTLRGPASAPVAGAGGAGTGTGAGAAQ